MMGKDWQKRRSFSTKMNYQPQLRLQRAPSGLPTAFLIFLKHRGALL